MDRFHTDRRDGRDPVRSRQPGGILPRATRRIIALISVRRVVASTVGLLLAAAGAATLGAGQVDGAAGVPLYLPVPAGAAVNTGGPHPDNGVTGVRNAVDFGMANGAAMNVYAAAAGHVQLFDDQGFHNCYLRISHAGGWATQYYHLKSVPDSLDGTTVAAGQLLGRTAMPGSETCGTGNFRHVHLSLFKDGRPASMGGSSIGGYTVHATAGNYCGYWTRNSDGALVEDSRTSCQAGPGVVNNQELPGVTLNGSSASTVGMAALTDGSYGVAFRGASNGKLYTWNSKSGSASLRNYEIAAGSTPAVARLTDGSYRVAFKGASNGDLYTWNSETGAASRRNYGIATDSSPAIAGLTDGSYRVAFKGASNGDLYTWNSETGAASRRNYGIATDSSPTIAGLTDGSYRVAFKGASNGDLYTWNSETGAASRRNYGIATDSSPTIAGLTDGSYRVAFKGASNGDLYTWNSETGAASRRNYGIATNSSPAIAGLTDGSYRVAFKGASNGDLYTWNSETGAASRRNYGIATNSSPAIAGLTDGSYRVAFKGASNSDLYTWNSETGAASHRNYGIG